METFVCSKGHASSEPDYCSECGARIGEAPPGAAAAAATARAGVANCPECGAAREQLGIVFCEVCGYNFETGASGDGAPLLPPSAPVPTPSPVSAPVSALASVPVSVPVSTGRWEVVVTVDPTLREAGSPEAPADVPPATLALSTPASLIGRRSQARAIFPEIDLSRDDAVSHRHALLQLDPAGGLTLRDIGASNGTRLNGREIEPLKDHKVAAGDEITLGHWSRLRLQVVD